MNQNMKMLSGVRWRASHQHSVDAILGQHSRTVSSRGTQFLNQDTWTARFFVEAMCNWAKGYRFRTPEQYDVHSWINHANGKTIWNPGIVIANTPDQLPSDTAAALVGGAYHEAWHTKYSRRTRLQYSEVARVHELWGLVDDWSPLMGAILTWSNVIEDIRIERVGCREFPGTSSKMEALQDLILRMEREGRARVPAIDPAQDLLSTVMCSFRDLGLGYKSPDQLVALKSYEERCPEAWNLVNSGKLRPLLDRAIALKGDQDLECLWLALEVVAFIANSSSAPQPQPQSQPQPEKGEKGEGEDQGESSPEQGDPGDGEGEKKGKPPAKQFKVGDRARLNTGPFKGREVEVTNAGSPDENGVQHLEFALVEEE